MKHLWIPIVMLMALTLWGNSTELHRDGWNLIAVCQDMDATDIDMTDIEEIQNQNGKSIYTGEWATFSNLEQLDAGYAYWIKAASGVNFESGDRVEPLEKPLLRNDWNLMGACEDIDAVDINMSLYEEIQSQDGETIYTGQWASNSNLEILTKGYGYWVKGSAGTAFVSKYGLSIPAGFDYAVINNAGTIVSSIYQNYTIKLFANIDLAADPQLNHTGVVVRINGEDTPVMQIQDSYRGETVVAAVYDSNGNLVAVSDITVVAESGAGTFIDITMESATEPEPNPGDTNNSIAGHFAVGYLPTWSIQGFHDYEANSSQIATIDPLYTHVVIAFAQPDATFNGIDFIGTGIEFNSALDAVKAAIEALQARGVKVTLAVGGATYNSWQPLADEQGIAIESTTHKKALKAIIDYLNLDGIDVDYEVSGADSANVDLYYQSILALKEVAGDKLLTMAGWSTGADCTAGTTAHADCSGKLSYWGGSAGRERLLFEKFRTNGYSVEELFDYIAIMTYDGGVERFDPVALYQNYQAIYEGPLAIGFEIPAESWGGAEMVASNAQAEACESTSMISGDSYNSNTTKQHYSVERLVNFINTVPDSGVMLWSLYEAQNGAGCAGAIDYEGFNDAVRTYLQENNETNETNPPVTAESTYHDVLGLSLKFYEAQRAVGPFPTVEWRNPASTTDGADVGVDLNGGWFDAGDHVKFNLPMSYSVGMLNWSMIEGQEAYIQAGKLAYGKDQVKYALDYLLNTYDAGADLNSPADDKVYFQVADGHVDHGFWGPPEEMIMNRPTFTCDSNGGCAAVAGSMAGAFASGAILFAEDSAYATRLLDAAKRLQNFATAYPTDTDYSSVGQDFYKLYSNNKDQMAWGAMWLYRATHDSQYLTQAKNLMSSEYPWGHAWDNMVLGVDLMLVQAGESSYQQRIEDELNAWINLSNGVSASAGGLRVRDGIQWGNLRYVANVAYIALMYSESVSDETAKQRLIDFAKSQIDYMLGENPNGFSYVVGYGENYPLRPHHRAASGTTLSDPNPNRYVIEGALVGGPMSANDNDYQDVRDGEIGWTANEVATDYNAGFTGALAKLALLYGTPTTPKTDAEIVALDRESLTFDRIRNQNLAENQISSNLNLVSSGVYGSSISWQSSNTAVISQTGVVTRPSATQGNQTVTLTATLTKGVEVETKSFVLTVIAEQSDSESVALAKAALTFDTIKNQNSAADNIQTALTLSTQGAYDTTISWASSHANVISTTGAVTPQSSDTTVTLTATITKGSSSDTKSFVLVVPAVQVAGACQVNYFIRDEWNTGATVDVTVTNQIGNLFGWEVTFSFPDGQTISGDLWNGVETQTGSFVKVLNESYNAQINKGGNIEFGFVLNHHGVNGKPNDFRLNGQLCDGQTGGVTKPSKPILTGVLENNQRTVLTWEDTSDNEDNFLVYRSVDLNSWELVANLASNSVSYEENGLEIGHSYRYKVTAKNIAGTTDSDLVTLTPVTIAIQDGVTNEALTLITNCQSCHVPTDSASHIPIIDGMSRDHLEKVLQGYQNGTRYAYAMDRIMDGYSSDEMELMMNHFANQTWVGNSVVSYDVDTIVRGEELYIANCTACHGTDGKKDEIMLSGQSEQYLVDTMMQYAKGLHSGDFEEGMRDMFLYTIGENAEDIQALAKYLAVGLQVPEGDNDTIRGFKADYRHANNTIEVSWLYVNPASEKVEVLLNDVVVATLTDLIQSSVILSNNGTANFVTGESYAVKIRVTNDGVAHLSNQVIVDILSAEDKGKEYYNAQCKVCHGVNGTSRDDITDWDSSVQSFVDFTRSSGMDTMYYSGCDDECLEYIGIYVENVLIPRLQDNNDSAVAVDVASDIPRGYRLLNRREYTNTLYSLFEIEADETRNARLSFHYTDLPKDNIVEGYDTSRDMIRMDEEKVKALNLMASKVEEYLASLQGQSGNDCWIGNYNFCTANKTDFLNGFATKIFRRPLTQTEQSAYNSLESVAKIVGDMLVSPNFLYRSEMGELNGTTGIYELDNYEIATAIAYTIAGTTPDEELLSLAAQSRLKDANTRVTQAVRLAQLQSGKDKLDDFIGRWLLEDDVYSLASKNPVKYDGYNDEVRKAQSEQILKFFRMVMEDTEHSSYHDLFVNDKMMTNKTLSDYYGEGISGSSTFEEVPATDKRYGILTLGAVASKYANSEEAHPFKRGKFVLSRLMCHPMGPPGNGGDVPAVEDHLGENTRDRYANHVNDPSCAACHNMIDPIGFTWENYDGSGRYRTHEDHPAEYGGPKPIDASVTLKGLLTFDESETHGSEGIQDVSAVIADSDRGAECMAFQYYRYTSGDMTADIENSQVVKKIVSDFKAENYDLQGLFTNIVKLQSFITRTGE